MKNCLAEDCSKCTDPDLSECKKIHKGILKILEKYNKKFGLNVKLKKKKQQK